METRVKGVYFSVKGENRMENQLIEEQHLRLIRRSEAFDTMRRSILAEARSVHRQAEARHGKKLAKKTIDIYPGPIMDKYRYSCDYIRCIADNNFGIEIKYYPLAEDEAGGALHDIITVSTLIL